MEIINGHYRDEQGLLTPGIALIERTGGKLRQPETGEALTCRHVRASGVEYDEISNGVWVFIPDTSDFN